jgi:hypothetical protein
MLPVCIVAAPELLVIVDESDLLVVSELAASPLPPPPQPASVTAIAVAIAAQATYLGVMKFMSWSPLNVASVVRLAIAGNSAWCKHSGCVRVRLTLL